MNDRLKAPLLVQWEVTYSCNKRCIHCYNQWNIAKRVGSEFNTRIAESITDDIIKNEIFHVVVTGGEPLIVFDQLLPYLKKLHSHGITISLNSNLALLDGKKVDQIKEVGITHILASFNGSTPELDYNITGSRDSFSNTLNGIKTAIANGIGVSANMVLTRLNIGDIYNTARLMVESGVKKFTVNKAIPPVNCEDFSDFMLSKEVFQKVPGIMKRIRDDFGLAVSSVEAYPLCLIDNVSLMHEVGFDRLCLAGKTFCVISTTGGVRSCIAMNDSAEVSIENAWKDMKPIAGSTVPEACVGCNKYSVCGGGCMAVRRIQSGNADCIDLYATPENKLIANVAHMVPSTPQGGFMFCNNVRNRKEPVGGILYVSLRYYEIVDNRGYFFYQEFRQQIFTVADVLRYCECSQSEANAFIMCLLNKKIIRQAV